MAMTTDTMRAAVGAMEPCPFCGCDPEVGQRPATEGEGAGMFLCFISCFCDGYSANAHQHAKAATAPEARAIATAAWNRRAPIRAALEEGGEPNIYDVVPPSAAEWFADCPGIANHDWRGGWDACRNRCRTLLDEHLAASPTAAPKEEAPKPVAWVEVKDSYEGPYTFHGLELMAVGKHHLYTRTIAAVTQGDAKDAQVEAESKHGGRPMTLRECMEAEEPGVAALYDELLYAVGRKFQGESRHETALRYIRQAEEAACKPGQATLSPSLNEGKAKEDHDVR